MDRGNWVPIDKAVVYLLPKTRRYTELEALLSITIDINNGREGTIRGYSALWGWSRTKVKKFITDLKKEPEKYQRTYQKSARKRHSIRLIVNNLQNQKSQKSTAKEPFESHRVDPTIKNNIKTNKKEEKLANLLSEYEKEKDFAYTDPHRLRMLEKEIRFLGAIPPN